ncbi:MULTISPECIES: DUF5384 family protein [unclassified Saccharibacter]|uniref:DUF5384 family protein n=1 Tax=unclassified Saccharibacter TaxID=2648722 RepID=UPI0013213DE5|nr:MULTISPECIES: DUF5384 family protein [unclassified Saccharibacter]MXV36770.1 hypothetical protein [Saccharibacter sp. EH611]MXV58262.1 hypothetical protein [Saccharibacter sp. EH70]MXV65718.1 hypothetical protein [Saccharibacter sp. EH60]
MRKHRLLSLNVAAFVLASGVGSVAWGQATDPAQLDQLGRLQDSQDARRVALQQAQEEATRRAAQRQIQQSQAKARAFAQANARAFAAQQAQAAQRAREQQDDQRYRDANRALDLQERQLQLKMAEARANHAEDYVQKDLQQQQASIDNERAVVQGDQKLKSDVGQATRMSQRHWWQWKD